MSATASNAQATETARSYYNSPDADTFYHRIWGGEDIHIGLYEADDEPIADASRRTVAHMADLLDEPGREQCVLDMGAGYGGAARYLASTFGCRVVALNLSEVENQRHRELNRSLGMEHLIDVVDGSFEQIPAGDREFDFVWSQDAILHSGQRAQVIAEAARVLKPGGVLIFTDPMQSDHCPAGVLQPVLDRIHLESLASPVLYRTACRNEGLEEISFEDLSGQLTRHYRRVLQETMAQGDLLNAVSPEYIERMKQGLQHWIDASQSGYLCWGIFRFRKC